MNNKLEIIMLQTKSITENMNKIKDMLNGCRDIANNNIETAKSLNNPEIAYAYEHISSDIETVSRYVDTVLTMLENEKKNEHRARYK